VGPCVACGKAGRQADRQTDSSEQAEAEGVQPRRGVFFFFLSSWSVDPFMAQSGLLPCGYLGGRCLLGHVMVRLVIVGYGSHK